MIELKKHKYKSKFLIGTGENSLKQNVEMMNHCIKNDLNRFLIMPPAYYKYGDDQAYSFFENIIKKVKFPIIQSGRNKNPQLWTNLPENIDSDSDRLKLILSMDKINKPIPLVFDDKINYTISFGYLHYGDSRLIQKIQIWTYIELLSIGIFILFGFIGFSFIRNSEKQYIWVGLSRETAHQLGTPVSALLGWLDYFKND